MAALGLTFRAVAFAADHFRIDWQDLNEADYGFWSRASSSGIRKEQAHKKREAEQVQAELSGIFDDFFQPGGLPQHQTGA
jgi:hypothetical protein